MSLLPKSKRQKHILFWLILILPIIVLESYFGVRYADKHEEDLNSFRWDTQTLWKIRPDYTGEAFGGMPIRANQAGFRMGQETPLKSVHDIRILTLGDSRTYGYVIPDIATYSMHLQTRLRDLGVDAEVLNAGTHGYTAVQSRAKLEQCLKYQPDIAIFAPGYNDRRYTVVRPPDNQNSFKYLAWSRRVIETLSISNMFFGFIYELGQSRLNAIRENPPPLDQVEMRVPEKQFRNELIRFVEICNENMIKPVFLLLPADPYVYEKVEQAGALIEAGEYAIAKVQLEELYPTLHSDAHMLYRYYLGLCYRGMGDEKKAKEQFAMHLPSGSLHGEAILRREETYFDIFREVATQENVLLINAKEIIINACEKVSNNPTQCFHDIFVDECHYDKYGHMWVGRGVAEILYEDL